MTLPRGERFEGQFEYVDKTEPLRWNGGENSDRGVYVDLEGNMHAGYWIMWSSGYASTPDSPETQCGVLDFDGKAIPPGSRPPALPRPYYEVARHLHPDLYR